MEKKRANLQINYRLFTEFNPPTNTLGPFTALSTLLYCDLVNMICNEERQTLGTELTVELYTCEGYPMACKPASYIRKLSEWCLEDYPGIPLLYAIPRLKNYSEKCEVMATNLPKGNDVIFISNKDYCMDPIQININCSIATYPQLIKHINEITGIPAHVIHLKRGDNLIYCDQRTNTKLSELDITNQAPLTIKLDEEFWSQNKNNSCTYSVCKPVWHNEQSDFGKSFFYGCLFVLSSWMSDQKQEEKKLQTLGHIRSLTDCPPLIHSLMVLFSNKTITLPHRVAIQEILMLLFRTLKPKAKKWKITKGITIQGTEVTNYSNMFWAFFIEKSTRMHANTEIFETFELTNPQTGCRLKNPVLVRDPKGKDHVVDQSEKIESDTQIKILLNYKRMLMCFSEDTPMIWNRISIHSCGDDLTDEWNNIKKILKTINVLCVQAPLNVKSTTCPIPSIIPVSHQLLGVYCDKSKANDEFIYLNVVDGNSVNFDCEQLDTEVKRNPPMCYNDIILSGNSTTGLQTITRDPEEIIMVILDTSVSMDSLYFEDVLKYDSVIQGFSNFADRTYAYNCPHLIGLTLFAKNCILNYPLSENFRQFTTQFGTFPPGNHTAVYDAIQFAVNNLNQFYITHPEYAHVPRRILCLTDGDDNSSETTSKDATHLLIDNNIIMDTVLLCEHQVETQLIAKASGGYSFQPNNLLDFVNIFQLEVMLMMKIRKYRQPYYVRGQKINLNDLRVQLCDKEPEILQPEKLFKKAQTPQKCLARAQIQKRLNSETNLAVTKRILKELAHYQHGPHPSIEIYPCEESIDFWQIILKGPEDSPYDGCQPIERYDADNPPVLGNFHLFIEFSNEYPVKPPNIRFVTPIYHCNINSAGRICHTILDRFYVPGIRIREIFDHIYGLLIDPAPDDPLDSVKADELRNNRELYLQKARDFTLSNKDTMTDLRFKILQTNETDIVNLFPPHLVCPLTMQLFEDPVITIHGETYEREAILDHLKSGKYYDPFSFQELKDSDKLTPNKAIKTNVEDYKQSVNRGGEL